MVVESSTTVFREFDTLFTRVETQGREFQFRGQSESLPRHPQHIIRLSPFESPGRYTQLFDKDSQI